MLEKAIEIEGLLRIIRDGKPVPETYALLKAKASALLDEALTLKPQETPSELPIAQVDFVMAAPVAKPETPEVVFSEEEPDRVELTPIQAKINTIATDTTTTDTTTTEPLENIAFDEDDDILLSFDDSADDLSFDADSTRNAEAEPRKQSSPVQLTMAMTEETTQQPAPSQTRQTKLKSAFSLNDRFLYARELFDGNMKTFDSTLESIESADDFSVIEDYFYKELQWNPDDSNVAAFMEVIRPYFKR